MRHCINCWCYITSNSSIWQYHCNDSLNFCGHGLLIMSQLFCMLFTADVRLMCLLHQVQETYIGWQGREGAQLGSLITSTSRFGRFISGEEPRQRKEKDLLLLTGSDPRIVQLVTKSLQRLRHPARPPPIWRLHFGHNSKKKKIIIIIICLLSNLSIGPIAVRRFFSGTPVVSIQKLSSVPSVTTNTDNYNIKQWQPVELGDSSVNKVTC